ncbi:methyltransferase domain-containing protein [Aurantimonas sp. C2-6-R+9]|uniref:glycine/sarcosine N-methyltransferase n=2 Tax=Aurantimonas TaxID=182269 RepID=UPI002E19F3B4|nr:MULTISPECIES: methyltransferase domain-containing protein [unclassified Aurantimonas]MEC5383613.1 methyltransferase domain-containing protein [Aurantimonas sp. C2-6-R+9]MEC5414536.1 methyltransferase domain-containing protein [Aurantimonas sp. C2-4-R8]
MSRTHATNAELTLTNQIYSGDPLLDRETDQYRNEYVTTFVEKWDELIDWHARAESEGQFFTDVLRARGKETVFDVATGTGFHSVCLTEAGFNVTSADGSASMLAKAFENGQARGLILKTVQADWRWLNRDIHGKYDAIICLGNSFTHLHEEQDRRRALAEFYAALKHDGILILDQRNYDTMLDEGFSSKHKYYYCGDKVSAEPSHIDEGLVRMLYSFPDGAKYALNLCPIRKNYVRRLLSEAGFQRVRTYGDFQETYAENDPDFFIHVAEKSALQLVRPSGGSHATSSLRNSAENYYDSNDADIFYSTIWGGEDLHIGIYDDTRDIRAASDETVDRMAALVPDLGRSTLILDIGAGYGGSMRRVVMGHGCAATCLNISETQNAYNRARTSAAGLAGKINILHGAFEDIPEPGGSYDVVWSQDAMLHSDQREKVLEEVWRVLKPGGYFVFTDPCQKNDVAEGVLQPVYDRLQLGSLGSFQFYRETAQAHGFEILRQDDMTLHLRTHYDRVREELVANYDRLRENGASAEYLDKMKVGLANWVKAADDGYLAWGIQLFRKAG